MTMLTIQEAFQRKFERQSRIKELELHASGHCAHIGQLSPGCRRCFVPNTYSRNFHLGQVCNVNCHYCFGEQNHRDVPPADNQLEFKAKLLTQLLLAQKMDTYPTISFTGSGEPLMNLDAIEFYMDFFRSNEDLLPVRPWYYLYTNGLLATEPAILHLKEMGFDEIRFHLGASSFAERVYRHMTIAAQHINTITVETPAWPPHRDKLFEMLPRLEAIGVKHLNLGEIQLQPQNQDAILMLVPDAEFYQNYYIHLDDGGLVYDLMAEVVAQGYSFSVLDCNSFVKSIQQAPGKRCLHEPVDGLCVDPDTVRVVETPV